MTKALEVYEAVRAELAGRLDEPAMTTLWVFPGALDSLVKIYRHDTKLDAGLLRFVKAVKACALELQEKHAECIATLGRGKDKEVFAQVRAYWIGTDKEDHPPYHAMIVQHHLDALDDQSHDSIMEALAELSAAADDVEALINRYTRITAGASANYTPTPSEYTGPPSRSRLSRSRGTRTCSSAS